jgi:hypothetical protein
MNNVGKKIALKIANVVTELFKNKQKNQSVCTGKLNMKMG